MATIKICDRCRGLINPPESAIQVSMGGKGYLSETSKDERELCVSCGMWLQKYLNGEAMVLRQEENKQ